MLLPATENFELKKMRYRKPLGYLAACFKAKNILRKQQTMLCLNLKNTRLFGQQDRSRSAIC